MNMETSMNFEYQNNPILFGIDSSHTNLKSYFPRYCFFPHFRASPKLSCGGTGSAHPSHKELHLEIGKHLPQNPLLQKDGFQYLEEAGKHKGTPMARGSW